MLKMSNAIALWSGGKDSCLACYKAKALGVNVQTLVNFTSPGSETSLSHGLPARLIADQALSVGIPLIQQSVEPGTYETCLKQVISKSKAKGAEAVVFGDIYLREHRDWLDRVCKEASIEPVYPLWGCDTRQLLREFIKTGFRSVIVSVREDMLSPDWLGRTLDEDFLSDLPNNIDPCGEAGEFHTLVLAGPTFSKDISIKSFKKTNHDSHWFLEIGSWQ